MKRRKGFTLIELLVVIAIIALLLSILMPSLNKVKEKAKEVICRTNLRGIGLAIKLYLEDYDGRAFDCSNANRHYWYTPNHEYRRLDGSDGEYYWGLAYVDYAEDPKVFGCPSFRRVFDMLYDTGDMELAPYAGFGLNAFFFRDADMIRRGVTGAGRTNRKVDTIMNPAAFIITQDHVEPRFEGWSDGGEQRDQLYIPSSETYNLAHYRPGGSREDFYWGIFRHSKKNRSADEPAEHSARLSTMNDNPNGSLDVLCLDGHVESIRETTGEDIRESRYSGIKQIH